MSFFWVVSLYASSCPDGISFKNFHSFWPAQKPDPTIAKFSSDVFQPSLLSGDELQALFEKYGFPVFRSHSAFLESYRQLRAQEAQGMPPGLIEKLSKTGHQAEAAAFFETLAPQDLQAIQGSERLWRQFVLPILFADIGRRIPLPQNRPWVVWDVGSGLGTTTDVLASMLSSDSKFVLIDRANPVTKYWQAQPENPNRIFVQQDVVNHVFEDFEFQKALGRDPELRSPDVVTILGSLQQWSGHADFERFLDHLVPQLKKHSLVVMELHYRHWSSFGRNLESVIEQSPYYQMMLARGLVPVREVRFPELGFSVFLFAHHLDIGSIYSEWAQRRYDSENARLRAQGPVTKPPPMAPWAFPKQGGVQ